MEKLVTCPRCSGLGVLPMYSHIEDGVCFLCKGTGTISEYARNLPCSEYFNGLTVIDEKKKKVITLKSDTWKTRTALYLKCHGIEAFKALVKEGREVTADVLMSPGYN